MTASGQSRLTEEELLFLERRGVTPLLGLIAGRLMELCGYYVYLGPELVRPLGRDCIRAGPFWEAEDGPRRGLYLRLALGPGVWQPGLPSLQQQREYLKVDRSHLERVKALMRKGGAIMTVDEVLALQARLASETGA
ncbi:MAG: hypothetical protein HY816_17105 [Candidatus Wallbacteria bacterium]|nr:hypothetical protein [Candidatus Wallbacteria bacterium]